MNEALMESRTDRDPARSESTPYLAGETPTPLQEVTALMGIVEKRGAFRAKTRFIHVANGVLRLGDDGDGTFGGYSPEDYSRNKSPFAFDGEAEFCGCPDAQVRVAIPIRAS
jgi:hypothetical protein